MTKVYSRFERLSYLGPVKALRVIANESLRHIDRAFKRTSLLSRPVSIQLEATTKCNLRCPHCISWRWDRQGIDMSFSDFRRIIDQFPYLVDINLQGIGEPLLNQQLFDMIAYCKQKNIMVYFTTNGTVMDDDIAERIVVSGVDDLGISVDGATESSFQESRRGATLAEVLANVCTLLAVRGSNKRPKVLFHVVVTAKNIDELEAIVSLAADTGVDGVDLETVMYWGREDVKNELEDEVLSPTDTTFVQSRIDSARNLACERGLFFYCRDLIDRDVHRCRQVFRSCFITADGFVLLCSDYPNPRDVGASAGSIFTTPFGDIWNNEFYQYVRRDWYQGVIPPFCRHCTKPYL